MSERVQLVGILNLTPDSFSDGGQFVDPESAHKRVIELFEEGADIVDIGAEATNPDAEPITVHQEWRRLKPIVERVLPEYNDRISIDTRHPEIIGHAAKYGRFIVNDVTTFQNPGMIKMAARYNLRCIASHLPFAANRDIRFAHDYLYMNDISEVRNELLVQREKMIEGGIPNSHIILDPGIGFGKDMVRCWEAVEFARHMPELPLMIAYSRKRFLATDPESGRPNPSVDRYDVSINLAAAQIAIASAIYYGNPLYLRVHDVAPHKALIDDLAAAAQVPAVLQGLSTD